MKRFQGVPLALVFLFSVASVQADTIQIDVDDFDAGATLVDFESLSLPTGLTKTAGLFLVGASVLFGSAELSNGCSSTTCSDPTITFDIPVFAAGAWTAAFTTGQPPGSANVIIVEAFNALNALLASVTLSPPPNQSVPVFVGFASDEEIAMIRWRVNNTGFLHIDNMLFGQLNTAVVPEPGTLALFGPGLFVLAFMRRKKAA